MAVDIKEQFSRGIDGKFQSVIIPPELFQTKD